MAFCWVLLAVIFVGTACHSGEGRGRQEADCADGLDNDGDGSTDCADSDCADVCVASFRIRLVPDTPQNRAVDLVYVLDDSSNSDADYLLFELSSVITELRRREAGMPDVHIGVTTTDLGSGGSSMTYCEGPGNEARLITSNCANPTGVPWIVDSAARDCLVERDAGGQCVVHACTQDNCAHEPATTLADDEDGCPRCRNYEGQSLVDVLRCVAGVGYWGCGFEQQLEAMYQALDDHPDNVGFLRDSAHLAVVLLNTEDDCSVADPHFWDSSDVSLESELGPLTDFRCFEFGVTCDVDDRLHVGERTGCRPRDDPEALLHPIRRYTDFLFGLKEPARLTVAALAGPVEDGTVTIRRDDQDLPYVASGGGGRYPGVRLKAFVQAVDKNDDLSWGTLSTYDEHDADLIAMRATGRRILRALGEGCAPAPPLGCTDIAAAIGMAGDGRACNDACLPGCEVTDVFDAGSAQETASPVVPCVQVCHDGACPDNTDPALAWYGGHPPTLDPDLPIPACWHFTYLESCEDGNGARLVVSRREAPIDWSYTEAVCEAVLPEASRCNDGLDNDGDCLTDLEDPDCGLARTLDHPG